MAYLTSKYYGGVAAGNATREHAEEQARQARLLAAKALLVELSRISALAEQNAASRGYVKLPVSAIETAFISRQPIFEFRVPAIKDILILDSAGLWNAAEEYLTEASAINALLDSRLAALARGLGSGSWEMDIAQRSSELFPFLDRLRGYLVKEMQRIE